MKYGESTFDLLYLLFAIVSGWLLLRRAKNAPERMMGAATLILGCGDAFHLVPRVLNYFVEADFTAALGIGKLITSITMTAFYLMLYYVWRTRYAAPKNKGVTAAVWTLSAVRVVLCLFPQNGWLSNDGDMTWGIIRNVPFILLGAIVCYLFFQKRKADRALSYVWLYVLLSFLFYIPVAVAAGIVPMLGMLMLPKTVCYMLMIVSFWRFARTDKT
jgi:hypothetical protein